MDVLFVDDDPITQTAFKYFLSRKDYHLTICQDGESALQSYQHQKHSLIIADIMMPPIDGFELCRRIRNFPDSSRSVILVITSHDSPEIMQRILDAGADDYLIKPDLTTADGIRHLEIRLEVARRRINIRSQQRQMEQALEHKLTSLTHPQIKLSDVELTDIIDLHVLQEIQDSFSEFAQIPCLIFDLDGTPITQDNYFTDFCSKVRSTPEGMKRCICFKAKMSQQASKKGPFIQHRCVIDNIITGVIPIIIQGRHVANWGIGQCARKAVDFDEIKQYAREIGIDEVKLIEAAKTLKRISSENFDAAIKFLDVLAKQISLLGLQNLQQARLIHEREQIEQELQDAKQTAEVASQVKSRFLSYMSHELKTPLNGILGYTQILKRDQTLIKKQRDAIDTIHQSSEHLLMMINDILDLSKIEEGYRKLKLTEFNFSQFLDVVVKIARVRAQQKRISFIYNISSTLPEFVYTDKTRLRQILLNLLSNAIKFTDEGEVIFQVGLVEKNSHKIRFQVKDTGTGIAPQHLNEIFQEFRQFSDEDKQKEGVGLGLAISQQYVELMGSRLQVKSVIHEGSTFWFDLELPEINTKNWNIVGYKGEKRRILILEDEIERRVFLKNMLTSLNFDIIEVDESSFLQEIEQSKPHLILMNPLMSSIDDGFKRIHQIKMFGIQVLLMISEDTYEKFKDVVDDNYIIKPVQIELLFEKIGNRLGLDWIYNDDISTKETNGPIESVHEIIAPSQEELAVFFRLAMIGNVIEIERLAQKLEDSDSKYKPFSDQIRRFAKGLQVNQIQEFLRQYYGDEQ